MKSHLKTQDLDIRTDVAHYEKFKISPRFMDQKVTPDVLSFISECVIQVSEEEQDHFTVRNIWDHEYFAKQVETIFNKPKPSDERLKSEYDKFVGQPLKTLSYAGVLSESKPSRQLHYRIQEPDLLSYIALKPYNAMIFLQHYLEESLEQSNLLKDFARFRESGQNQEDFDDLKQAFNSFMYKHSRINKTTELGRIFSKVLNVLAVQWTMRGTESGRVSKGRYSFSDLMYNRPNFRDTRKLKGESRAEALVQSDEESDFNLAEMQKTMRLIRNRHKPQSELRDQYSVGEATQVHHIFPQSKFGALRSVPENLIMLTATQHNSKAHPNNRTSSVDPDYQIECLLAKADSVEASLINGDGFYSRASLIYCINEGLGANLDLESSFDTIRMNLRIEQQRRNSEN